MRFESVSRSWLLAVTLAASASLVLVAVAWPTAGGPSLHGSKWGSGSPDVTAEEAFLADDGPSREEAPDLRRLDDYIDDVLTMRAAARRAQDEQRRDELERVGDTPSEATEPTYDARAQPWKGLQPARIAESHDDCVGYCFDGIVESVDRDDARVARVVVFGEGGSLGRAVVERTRVTKDSRSATYYGESVHFTCFDKVDTVAVPRFEGCAQVAKERRELGASRPAYDLSGLDLTDPL